MNSKTYNERKAKGLCAKCGKVKPVEGQVLCKKCREDELARRRACYAKNKKYREKLEEKEMTYSERLRRYAKRDNYKTACIIAEIVKDAPKVGLVHFIQGRLGETSETDRC